jgi:hypothetical protein
VGAKPKLLRPKDDFRRVEERMSPIFRVGAAIIILPVLLLSQAGASSSNEDLLKVREEVWRAWFAGDTKTLEEWVPPETIVMSGGEEKWKNQADVLRTAAEFHAKGENLSGLNSPEPKSSTLERSPSFGAVITWKLRWTGNDLRAPAE